MAGDVGIGIVARGVASRELGGTHDPVAVRLDEHGGAVLLEGANVSEHLHKNQSQKSGTQQWIAIISGTYSDAVASIPLG